jgi:cellulose synthase/poly-beta-1,6-N-acetylglucosamine synthase-like glycosyltransferase
MDHIIWYFTGVGRTSGLMPVLRAAAVCALLYQIDLVIVLGCWLARKIGVLSSRAVLEPENRHSAVLVLPTLLRGEDELTGLMAAMRSAAQNEYPGTLFIVGCIDGRATRPDLFQRLRAWVDLEPTPSNVKLHVIGTPERMGKAVAMDHGVEHIKSLVAEGKIAEFPTLFFNMDADSTLGPNALERLAYQLTRTRRLLGTPHLIVTSNVLVPAEDCFVDARSLFSMRRWIATLVAREYLTGISFGRTNTKLFPVNEVSGALFCTWSQVYLPAPTYARFIQSLRLVDWLKWWIGFPPPRFSEFKGEPLCEAMAGPGDDTWMTWMASSGTWKDGRICFDFPRTPLHAFVRAVLQYLSRPLAFDALAKVFTKTPTNVRALFRQRLRWNSSRVQDLQRWFPALAYHWQVGASVLISSTVVILFNTMFLIGAVAPFVLFRHTSAALPVSLLAGIGYMMARLIASIVALLTSECPAADWLKLISLPGASYYHIYFGEVTTFSPECTLRKGGLTRIALAYRLRRAILLAFRAIVFGDVPWGWFWFGWRETPWTPSGFDGWSSGIRPPAVYWPSRRRD